MKSVLLTLMIIFMGTGCGQNNASAPQAPKEDKPSMEALEKKYIKEGVDYLNNADLPKAIKSFDKAIAQNPQDPKPYFILAEVYMRLNNYESAISNLNSVVTLEPDNGPAYYFLGICKGLSGNRDEAIGDVERSAAIFGQKKDEENFKKAVTTLQQMMQAGNAAAPGEPVNR